MLKAQRKRKRLAKKELAELQIKKEILGVDEEKFTSAEINELHFLKQLKKRKREDPHIRRQREREEQEKKYILGLNYDEKLTQSDLEELKEIESLYSQADMPEVKRKRSESSYFRKRRECEMKQLIIRHFQ